MANWERIMDAYESWDIDSLAEEAHAQGDVFYDFALARLGNAEDADFLLLCAAVFFISTDDFFDGAEEDVFLGTFSSKSDYYAGLSDYKNGGEALLQRIWPYLPRNVLESLLRMGCCYFAAKGYMSEKERNVIRRFAAEL